jgi:hypothetical protein
MKKKFRNRSIASSRALALVLVTIACAWGICALRPTTAHATAELDRLYAFETVGLLKSWDNVDGLFTDYVASGYKDYFAGQTRFVTQDLSKADELFDKSKLPYNKVINDPEILAQLARSTRAQTLLRTRIQKEGPNYRFTVDWLHSPKMDVLSSETFSLAEPASGQALASGNIKAEMAQALDRLFTKVPFQGQVTGRDNNSVTINLGMSSNIKPGDTIRIATLDEVKKHPLLKEIVEWRLTSVGRLEIESVEEKIAFARIVEEEPGRQITRFQKISQILPKPIADGPAIIDENKLKADLLATEQPKLGWIRGGLSPGGFSRQYTTSTTGRTGSNLSFGANAEGELWLNREWFFDLALAYGSFGFSQADLNGGSPLEGLSGGFTQVRVNVGHSFFITGDFFGPRAWLKAGYRSTAYDLAYTPAEFLGPVTFGSLFLGVGGDLPIRDGFGGTVSLDFGVLPSATETNVVTGTGVGQSVTDVSFFVGGYYRWTPRLTIRAGLEVFAHSANFLGSTSSSALSQRVVTFAPSLLYYF